VRRRDGEHQRHRILRRRAERGREEAVGHAQDQRPVRFEADVREPGAQVRERRVRHPGWQPVDKPAARCGQLAHELAHEILHPAIADQSVARGDEAAGVGVVDAGHVAQDLPAGCRHDPQGFAQHGA
jgi:hypothetical protein